MREFDEKRLPDLLTASDGEKIDNQEAWERKRRPEISEFFKREVFGVFPPRPYNLAFRTVRREEQALGGRGTQETVEISFEGPYGTYTFELYLFFPKSSGPHPMAVLICNRDKSENMDLTRRNRTGFWPVEAIIDRGWATCAFYTGDLNMDEADGYADGVHRIFQRTQGPNDWATISAWAWAALRVMDYLQQDSRVDLTRISLTGQSRGGKTALYAGLCDERYQAVFSSCSGCVGAALSRFKEGENIRQINERFPYWFCREFKKYDDHEFEMPLDQHALLASIAPRLLYVTSATEDLWADPDAELESICQASPIYRLYGFQGMPKEHKIIPNKPLWGDRMGYHRRQGEHDLTEFDWMMFLDFLEERFK